MSGSKEKILIIGPAWVGDMVMAQTLFTFLKNNRPNVELDVLAPDWSRPLLQRMPEVNKAYSLPFAHGELFLGGRYQIGAEMRQNCYDQAIILPNSFKSALIPWFARIPKRTSWLGEMRWGLLNDVRYLDKKDFPLMVQRFMALGLEPGEAAPESYAWPALQIDASQVQAVLNQFQLDTVKPTLVLCPGAEFGPAKRWPAEHYAAVAQEKLAQGWQVWLLGSKKDSVVAAEIQQQVENRCVDLTGKTSLANAIDLMSQASLVVSNDSGLMHIAAALNRPLVVVYGASSPKFTPPLSEQVESVSLQLECSPCFKRECPLQHLKCLQQLQPSRVLQAMENVCAS